MADQSCTKLIGHSLMKVEIILLLIDVQTIIFRDADLYFEWKSILAFALRAELFNKF